MAKGKSKAKIGGPGSPSLVGGSAVIKPNRNTVSVPVLSGSKAGKAKRGKRSGGTLSTLSGKSGIMQPPIQGGYNG